MTPQSDSLKPRLRRRPVPIGLTPLIDVVFILLIFFMLASRVDEIRSIEMAAPVQNGGPSAHENQPKVILVQGKEKYQIQHESYALDDLQLLLQQQGVSSVLIKTGAQATVQDLTRLLDRLRAMAVQKVSLFTLDEAANDQS